jgi:hypothetical protein
MQCYFCGIYADPALLTKIMDYNDEVVFCCNDCALKFVRKLLDSRIISPETVMQLLAK